MSLEALQVAGASCPDGLPVRLGQTYSHNPPTPVMCVATIPVPLRRSTWLLSSQLLRSHGAEGRAALPTSTSW